MCGEGKSERESERAEEALMDVVDAAKCKKMAARSRSMTLKIQCMLIG